MNNIPKSSHLMLVKRVEGPITRLGIRDRFPEISRIKLAAVLTLKTALLVGILYFIHTVG